jgi:predicted flap endonuclease-1-like 5' DNA nuclease
MSSLLSSLGCCFWWFLAGTLLGWLLNRCMCKCCCKAPPSSANTTHTPAAPAKLADVPAAPVAKAAPAAPAAPKAAAPASKAAAPAAAVIDLAAAKKAGFAIKNANDLTIVEGIGPKINELFNNAGIKTFAQLAAATVPQMRKILDDGGSRFRIANPSTWAQQAALAADNKWAELKKLQDKLSAGLKK